MLDFTTALGLIFVCGFSTLLGSVPVFFHHYFKDSSWNFWESFGAGVMVGASLFSLFLPALTIISLREYSYFIFVEGLAAGFFFIIVSSLLIRKVTSNLVHQKAFLFVFVMALHNVPEGMSVGVDVAALGWRESLPLSVAIFIQNLPEGFASSLKFLLAGFGLKKALFANALTALVESISALGGFRFALQSGLTLPFSLSFAGASMLSVVLYEVKEKHSTETESFNRKGFVLGFVIVGILDLLL
jgi:zinc transporter, ZIP family